MSPVAVTLTAQEQEMYNKAHTASKALFQQYRQMGNATINKHLLQVRFWAGWWLVCARVPWGHTAWLPDVGCMVPGSL